MLGRRAISPLGAVWLCAAFWALPAKGSEPAPDSGNAAAVLDLARFAEWPRSAHYGASFRICLRDDDPALALFTDLLGQKVRGREVTIHTLVPDALDRRPCHAVYFSDGFADRGSVAKLVSLPVLTVSPQRGFAESGGVVELHRPGVSPRLSVSAAVVTDHQLKISAQLLAMAEVLP